MDTITVLINLYNRNVFEFEKKNLINLSKKLNKVIVINVGIILKNKPIDYEKNLNDKFFISSPNNIKELRKLLVESNFPILQCCSFDLKFFKINFLLSRLKQKIFVISNLGYQPQNFNYEEQSFYNNILFFIKKRFLYYLNRILILLNVYPKIDFFFESSSFVIDSINKGLSKKLKKFSNKLDITYYKQVIKINSRSWDNHYFQNYKKEEKYIVFAEGMIFDHLDRILREGPVNLEDRKKYYFNIKNFLKDLSKKFNKEVIVCLHPKNNISEKNDDFEGFKCFKYQTDKYINKASIVLFHEGSSVVEAIMLRKKIINLYGKSLGPYVGKRSRLYCDLLDLKRINLDNYEYEKELEKLTLLDLEKRTNNYDNYIKNNIVIDPNTSGTEQIVDFFQNFNK